MINLIKNNLFVQLKKIKTRQGLAAAFVSIIMGLVCGPFVYNLPDFTIKNKLLSLFIAFNTDITDKTNVEIISGIILNGLIYFLIMFFSSGNIFGKELSLIASAIKASGIGVLIAFFYNQYGTEGFKYAFLVFMPGKLMFIPAMLILTECCFNVSEGLHSGLNSDEVKLLNKINILKSLISLGFMFISWLIDFICLIGFSDLIDFT